MIKLKHVVFDPTGADEAPYTTEVEILLGGVGQVVFADGTEQFMDYDYEPVYVYSPRLLPEALERFCKENINYYMDFHKKHERQLLWGDRIPMEQFWSIQPSRR